MKWQRIEAGHYRSIEPSTYIITRQGKGLFKEGWRPSWRLRRKDEKNVKEFGSLRAAKATAEEWQRRVRTGGKRLKKRYISILKKEFPSYLTAIHEAGHILVGWMTSNRHIISATCVPGDGYDGRVLFAMPPGELVDAHTAKGMIMTGFAGDVAVALVTNQVFDVQFLNDSDRQDLLEFGPGLCGGRELDEFTLSLAEETLELLRSNEEPLMLLADTLRRMDNLNSRQIGCLRRRLDLVLPKTMAA